MKTIQVEHHKYEFDYDEFGIMVWPVAMQDLRYCNVFNTALDELDDTRGEVAALKAQLAKVTAERDVAQADRTDALLVAHGQGQECAAADVERLDSQLKEAQHWRERHCLEAEAAGKQAMANWHKVQALTEERDKYQPYYDAYFK